MPILAIARLGHPVIRQRAAEVGPAELSQPGVQALIDNMIETMRDGNGVGLAANQVYELRRIIIVEVSGNNPRYPNQPDVQLTVIVNPVIARQSRRMVLGWEGCLSIPDLRGKVPRSPSLKVTGLDRHGKAVDINASDFFARVIQHEVDHLDGVVFLDRMRDYSSLTHQREYSRYWDGK